MKKYLLSILLLAGALTACEDELQLDPFNSIGVENAFVTNDDFSNAIRGVYASLRNGNYYGGNFYLIPDVISDNTIICSQGRNSFQDYFFFNYNGNIALVGFWSAGYNTILRANHVLENINKLPDGDFKNNIEGQALALRALAHFDLARVYSAAPQFAAASDLGIPYVTTTSSSEKPSRPSVADTFTNIEQDLIAAVPLIASESDPGFLNKAGVYALQSRLYLYIGDYQATIDAADDAIAEGITVAPIASFADIWTDETEDDVIFKARNTDNDRVTVGVVYNQTGPTGVRSEYVPDYSLYQLYGVNDVRRDAYFSTSAFGGFNFNHIVKWYQRPGSNQAVVDMKILRAAEVYLNKAEAHAALDQDGAALTALNMVRTNRYTGFVDPAETGNALDAAVALERRLELAFEGHRLFDLKRQNLPITRSAFGDYSDGTGVSIPAESRTLPASSPMFQMPIPQEELNANENLQPNPSNG
ncbi:RagB/SusD family nutrient uptake outer membrane protein [Chryseotalea sanaruensis]|uniref:RagB/SusD family nutrient uptake outer membrane protein n=1 Tax=Chryseotalea sanaruensis TaxID=2482724 RepID=A0A401UBF1_9BACT|nr:RagB/SusD family nutrient uptake outer membrane protein [Chryseotalea sanaruensis]GCC52233.1 RagB/SusD family nutrient uptake outer membrane protein [Chryseotalea sanaruensis]